MLKELDSIKRFTNTVLLSPTYTYFKSDDQTIAGKMYTPDIESEVGIYDGVGALINTLNLFTEPTVSIVDSVIHINENHDSAKFFTSSKEAIKKELGLEVMAQQFDNLGKFPTVLEVKVNEFLLARLRKAASIIPNARLIITSKNGVVKFGVKDTEGFNTDSNSFVTEVETVSVNKDFEIILNINIIAKVPNSEYLLRVIYSEQRNAYRIIVNNLDESLTLLTSCAVAN